MDSSNLSKYPEPRAGLGAEEELMLLLVLLCNSEGSQTPTPAVKSKANLSVGQNNRRSLALVNTRPVTGTPP
jgi:hypothetical protein